MKKMGKHLDLRSVQDLRVQKVKGGEEVNCSPLAFPCSGFPSFHFIIVVSSHKSLRISPINSNVPFSESPEWTRKEHKNGVQENRKNISDEHKENLDPDVATLLDDFRTEKRLFNKCTQSEECALSSTPSDASPCSSTPRTIISKLLPHEMMSKCNESEECLVSSNKYDARPYYSMQSSILSNYYPMS